MWHVYGGNGSYMYVPVEVEDEFHEAALEKVEVSMSSWGRHLVHAEHGPGMHRWVDITELELIGYI